MKSTYLASSLALILTVSACENNGGDTTRDFGAGSGDLSKLQAGIWVDPRGCDH